MSDPNFIASGMYFRWVWHDSYAARISSICQLFYRPVLTVIE